MTTIILNITTAQGELMDRLEVTHEDAADPVTLAELVRDCIERRFETTDLGA